MENAAPRSIRDPTPLTLREAKAVGYFARSGWSVDVRCRCPAHDRAHASLRGPGDPVGRCFEDLQAVWYRWQTLVLEHERCRMMVDALVALDALEESPARDALWAWLTGPDTNRGTGTMPQPLRRWIAPLLHEQDSLEPGWLERALLLDIHDSPRRFLHQNVNIALASRRKAVLGGALPQAGVDALPTQRL